MKRLFIFSLLCFSMGVFAQNWSVQTQIKGAYPTVKQIFEVIAQQERGVIRDVAVNVGEVEYPNTKYLYDAQNEYFWVRIGEDDASGDQPWQKIEAKLWRVKDKPLMWVATYYIDHSAQEEQRYLNFYEYNRETKVLKTIKTPFKLKADFSELLFQLPQYGRNIEVKRFGEKWCELKWNGQKFTVQ